MRNPKIKLISDRKRKSTVSCCICGINIKYLDAQFFIDGNNIAITNNAKPYCEKCFYTKKICVK
jgi:hypothetical protein